MKEHVRILLIGDEGVGKSSLISSYISRHFPQEVPSVMTDAIIPPESTANNVKVTIMDSSARSNDRESLQQKILQSDSIIALYDTTRPDTFDSLTNNWLPLIKDINSRQKSLFMGNNAYNKKLYIDKPVILVGTKIDLLVEEEDTDKLHSLLLSFPFVLLCSHCSAAKLQDVDQVFYFGELSVTFPLSPIFDVSTHEFTPPCRRAFLRIFRIFDIDSDNLLNDSELCATQLKCFDASINTEEIMAIKKHISKSVPNGIFNNFVTFEGFLGLIKMIIENNQFQIPWTILRRFDYDDDLYITVPSEISKLPKLKDGQVFELSLVAQQFLLNLSRNAYLECEKPILSHETELDSNSDSEEYLSWDALMTVLSVLPPDFDNPWANPPEYKTNIPHQSILLSGFSHIGANLSFESWITQWNILALNDPVLTQNLLFRLGYVERGDLGLVISTGTVFSLSNRLSERISFNILKFHTMSLFSGNNNINDINRSTLRVCILGDNEVGKSSLVWNFSGLRAPGNRDVEKGVDYVKSEDTIVIGGCCQKPTVDINEVSDHGNGRRSETAFRKYLQDNNESKTITAEYLRNPYYISFSAIPYDKAKSWLAKFSNTCDLVVLMFQCGDVESFDCAQKLEKLLPDNLPRLYVGSKFDLLTTAKANSLMKHFTNSPTNAYNDELLSQTSNYILQQHELVYQKVTLHLQEHKLIPVSLLSTATGEGLNETYTIIINALNNPKNAIPIKEREKKNIVQVSSNILTLTVALGVVTITICIVQYNSEVKSWFQNIIQSTRDFFASKK